MSSLDNIECPYCEYPFAIYMKAVGNRIKNVDMENHNKNY